MKQLNLLLLTVFLLAMQNIKAAETEPNNTRADANTLALNGSTAGAINVSGDEDWYKITANADGKLNIAITVSNGLYLQCYIYDNDGSTQLAAGSAASTATISYDGAASGTYYVKLIAYYNGQLPAYTVSATLTQPAQANDNEPNNSRANAIALPLNGSKTGHVGYYYNLQRDTADWYKVTTNADGLLRISAEPTNGYYIYIQLYDNNGTTVLNSASGTVNAVLNEDGLAAGTYYVKVTSYYNYQFEPYTLSDSLFTPAQANDIEPNNSKADAKVLPLNGSKTGHIGYYYNLQRDTADWYKVTANADGLLRISATPTNGYYIYIQLYDNNGTTVLNSASGIVNAVLNEDGLAAGTYYVKVTSYYNYQFEPYTISDSLLTYNYANDAENNGKPYLARTVLSNSNTDGHVGFYYNNIRDTADWYKINYTGSGNLDFTINEETPKNGSITYLAFQVYKDTAASPIHSSSGATASRTVNLTNLTQGYYWIKFYSYYNYQFSSYSFSNSFTQVAKATIKLISYDTAASCSNTNYIKVKPVNGNGPFTVQLYRFGVPYGSAVTVEKNKVKQFSNLPTGSYYATAYADGATGNTFGKSKIANIEPIPTGLTTTNITSTQAKLNWTIVTCAAYYTIQYKVHGTTTWLLKKTVGNVQSFVLRNLSANTTYDWRVATSDSANGIIATGAYADSITFTTAAGLIADDNYNEEDLSVNGNNKNQVTSLFVSPNPASSFFVIHFNNDKAQRLNAMLFDMNGKAIWTSGLMNADFLNGKQVNVSQFAKGVFYLRIMNENGVVEGNTKVVIAH